MGRAVAIVLAGALGVAPGLFAATLAVAAAPPKEASAAPSAAQAGRPAPGAAATPPRKPSNKAPLARGTRTGKQRAAPRASSSKPKVVFDQAWAAAPSARYGALEPAACHAELRTRGVEFTVVPEARGVAAPVRLSRDVAGVVWRTELPAAERAHAPWDVVDCRVVLALHDWSPRLRARGIVEALLFSAWRPPPLAWPKGELATRHPGALAVDVKRFVRENDPVTGAPRKDLDVDRDWDPRLGAPICGPTAPAPSPATPEAAELRAITCEVDGARLFTVVLTPHYDRAHHNHLHLEITPDVTWRLTR